MFDKASSKRRQSGCRGPLPPGPGQLGDFVGAGAVVGAAVGGPGVAAGFATEMGCIVGVSEGSSVGIFEGGTVGIFVGLNVGDIEGDTEGLGRCEG